MGFPDTTLKLLIIKTHPIIIIMPFFKFLFQVSVR